MVRFVGDDQDTRDAAVWRALALRHEANLAAARRAVREEGADAALRMVGVTSKGGQGKRQTPLSDELLAGLYLRLLAEKIARLRRLESIDEVGELRRWATDAERATSRDDPGPFERFRAFVAQQAGTTWAADELGGEWIEIEPPAPLNPLEAVRALAAWAGVSERQVWNRLERERRRLGAGYPLPGRRALRPLGGGS
jgi:hypothetical protein